MELLVILDNGHGGIINGQYQTPGKRSLVWEDGTQLFEGVYNRILVHKIKEGLDKEGIQSIILVPGEEDVSLVTRVKTVNSLCKIHADKKVVLCSVHGNAAESPDAKGFEVYTTKGNTQSDIIADIYAGYCKLYFANITKFRQDTSDGDMDKESNFYIIKNTLCPAVLTENGFFTNREECRKMLTPLWQDSVATVHVKTFVDYAKKIKDL